jgi:hypothetical protein
VTSRAAFIVGCPGVGKTTLVENLLGPHPTQGVGRWTVGRDVCALGPYPHGGGADALPFARAVFGKAYAQLPLLASAVAILDGTRFSAVDAQMLAEARVRLAAVVLRAAPATIARRRGGRGSKPMDAVWLAQQVARAERLSDAIVQRGGRSVGVDAERPAHEVAREVRLLLGLRSSP